MSNFREHPTSSRPLFSPDLITLVISVFALLVLASSIVAFLNYFSVMPVFDTLGIIKVLDRDQFPISRWQYMLQEHNEHRIVLTKAVLLFDYYVLHGQKWLPRTLIFLFNALAFVVFLKSYKEETTDGAYWKDIRLVPLIALFWGLFQLRNFDCVFQLQFFVVNFGAAISFYNFAKWSEESVNSAWLVSSLLIAGFTAFNMGNGLLVSVVMVIASLLLRKQLKVQIAIAIIAVLTWLLYFKDYTAPPSKPTEFQGLKSLWGFGTYVVFFIGNIFRIHLPAYLDVWVMGLLGLLTGSWILVKTFFLTKQKGTQTLFYALIIAFSFASALAAASGRYADGPAQALNGRYASSGILLWSAIFSWILRPASMNRKWKTVLKWTLLVLFLLLFSKRQWNAFHYAEEEGTRRKLADISLIAGFLDLETIHIGYYKYQKNWIELMQEHKLALFSDRVQEIYYQPVTLSDFTNATDRLQITGSHDFGIKGVLQGYIYYGVIHGKIPGDRILRIADENGRIVGFACTTDFPQHIKSPYRVDSAKTHWKAYISGLKHDTDTLSVVASGKRFLFAE